MRDYDPGQFTPNCPQCGYGQPWGVDVRGVYDGILYWDCPACRHAWPRFPEGKLHRLSVERIQAPAGHPMTWGHVFWWWVGWCTGVLSLMQFQVWRARRRRTPEERHPMLYRIPTPAPAPDWDAAVDLELFVPTPREQRTPPGIGPLEECAVCGRAFKRLSQHQRMAKHGATQ